MAEFTELEKTLLSKKTSKSDVITFLNYELVRLENRKPSKQNKADKEAIIKTLGYLESNRDILKIKK